MNKYLYEQNLYTISQYPSGLVNLKEIRKIILFQTIYGKSTFRSIQEKDVFWFSKPKTLSKLI